MNRNLGMRKWLGVGPLAEYWIDSRQRSSLFHDVVRERRNIYH